MKYFSVISNSSIFKGMNDEEIAEVLKAADTKTYEYKKGEYILHAGERVEKFGMVLSGRALVIQEDFWGNRNIMTALSAGELFAESFACASGAVATVSVAAESDCSVAFISASGIIGLADSDLPFCRRVIKNLITDMASKNLRFNEKIMHMSQRTTREKLLSFLSFYARKMNVCEFDIPFSRQQMADYLSVERSAMSAELSRLRRDGIISYNKNHFVLHMKTEK